MVDVIGFDDGAGEFHIHRLTTIPGVMLFSGCKGGAACRPPVRLADGLIIEPVRVSE